MTFDISWKVFRRRLLVLGDGRSNDHEKARTLPAPEKGWVTAMKVELREQGPSSDGPTIPYAR